MKKQAFVLMVALAFMLIPFASALVNVDCGHGSNPACHENDVQHAFYDQNARDNGQDSARAGGDAANAAAIAAEAGARAGADSSESAARIAGDAANAAATADVASGLADEMTARSGADVALQESIDGVAALPRGGNGGVGPTDVWDIITGRAFVNFLSAYFADKAELEDVEQSLMTGVNPLAIRAARLNVAVTKYGVTCYPAYNPAEALCERTPSLV